MVRGLDGEKEALKQAADAASAMIPKLQAQKAQIEERIAALKSVVDAYETTCGKRSKISTSAPSDQTNEAPKKRAKKGLVIEEIEAALGDASVLEVKDLRDKIERMSGNHYGRGTIYSALGREENKKFVRSGNKWKLNPLLVQ
jgi:hypothetical protein